MAFSFLCEVPSISSETAKASWRSRARAAGEPNSEHSVLSTSVEGSLDLSVAVGCGADTALCRIWRGWIAASQRSSLTLGRAWSGVVRAIQLPATIASSAALPMSSRTPGSSRADRRSDSQRSGYLAGQPASTSWTSCRLAHASHSASGASSLGIGGPAFVALSNAAATSSGILGRRPTKVRERARRIDAYKGPA